VKRAKPKGSGRHLIADNRQRFGECWIQCDTCSVLVEAPTPDLLVLEWREHRRDAGFASSGKAPTGEPSPFGKFHLTGSTPVADWKRLTL
jgi:hypothetical protein